MIETSHQKAILTDAMRAFGQIGYRTDWFKQDYAFSDLYAVHAPQRTVDLGVFGQEPFDYRSACFGLQFAQQGESPEQLMKHVRALGAPQMLYVRSDIVERWQIRTEGSFLAETTPTAKLSQLITDRKREWNPSAVLRAKAGFVHPGPRQIDFVDLGLLPALEHEAARKVDELVRLTCALAEEHYEGQQSTLNMQNLFNLVFQLLVGKLLVDRKIPTSPTINFDDVTTVLDAVRNHYPSHDHDVLHHLKLSKSVAAKITRAIGDSFSFANLSAETLTYVYENTFVSALSRKKLGIHSTPSYVADYILSQMPVEDMHRSQWNVLDPTCGHGIFLIAAMRRMRALLPSEWTAKERHDFFVKRLHGVEMEAFSLEVAKLCLMLADFPEANGWDLRNHDIFSEDLLENVAKTSTIIVGNPPFEKFDGVKPLRRKPAELLSRSLSVMPAGGLFGMVLPRAFLDGSDYRQERIQLLEGFDLLSITTLSDRIFAHSDAETAIVIARKGERRSAQFFYREVLDADLEKFKLKQDVSWQDEVPVPALNASQGNSLFVPKLRKIWEHLAHLPTVSKIAIVRTGMRYKSNVDLSLAYSSEPGPSRRLGIDRVEKSFMQFTCSGQVYFSMDEDLQANGSWQHDWEHEKVIVPASRNSRGPWRYAAALDKEGLCVSRRFHGVWLKKEVEGISATVLAAILNSPVAAAFAYTHSFQMDIPIRTYENIPVPKLEKLQLHAQTIESFVNEYKKVSSEFSIDKDKARDLLMHIDAEMLRLYDLPPKLERALLDLFWGSERRVPFSFTGYMPPTYRPALPLHLYISPSFTDALGSRVINRLSEKKSEETLEFLRSLEGKFS